MYKLAIAALSVGILMCGTSVFAADESTTSTDKSVETTQKIKKHEKKEKVAKKTSEKRELSDAVTGPIAY
jgi:hypothetical protein